MSRRALSLPLLLIALLALGCDPQSPPDGAASARSAAPADPAESSELYTCGMHPQVLHEGPGTCPICGMDLTPRSVPGQPSRPSRDAAGAQSGERRIQYWVAPMDPTYIRDAPGKSPMGMDLVPVYEDEAPAADSGGVEVSPAVVQRMGVRTETVRRQTVFRHVRSIGQVEVGEDRLSVVNLRFGGWAERVYVDRTGDPVKAGEPLLDIYAPDLVSAQEEYLLAVRTQGKDSRLAQAARRKLDLWDLAAGDVRAIEREGVRRTFPIRAPRDGFVLHKNVLEGAFIPEGTDLYRIGDLSRIWVTAEVYEFDAPWVEVGQAAQMELAYEEGRVLEGRVAYIYPMLNEMSRTLRVRLEFENPDLRLRPGMFATVYIQYRRVDDAIAVPNEAILDSGRRKLVFIEVGPGRFEPREVVTGLTGDRRLTEIRSGLAAGERVVLSGQFLLDSESQLEEAIRKMLDPAGADAQSEAATETIYACPMHLEQTALEEGRCAVCGMDLEPRPAREGEIEQLLGGVQRQEAPVSPAPGASLPEHGHGRDTEEAHASEEHAQAESDASMTYALYTCPMHPEVSADEPGRCPICGMFLEQATGGATP